MIIRMIAGRNETAQQAFCRRYRQNLQTYRPGLIILRKNPDNPKKPDNPIDPKAY